MMHPTLSFGSGLPRGPSIPIPRGVFHKPHTTNRLPEVILSDVLPCNASTFMCYSYGRSTTFCICIVSLAISPELTCEFGPIEACALCALLRDPGGDPAIGMPNDSDFMIFPLSRMHILRKCIRTSLLNILVTLNALHIVLINLDNALP